MRLIRIKRDIKYLNNYCPNLFCSSIGSMPRFLNSRYTLNFVKSPSGLLG